MYYSSVYAKYHGVVSIVKIFLVVYTPRCSQRLTTTSPK